MARSQKLSVTREVKSGGHIVLKQYDRATGLIGSIASLPRKFAGSLVGERNKRKRSKGNPPEQAKDMYESFHASEDHQACLRSQGAAEELRVAIAALVVYGWTRGEWRSK